MPPVNVAPELVPILADTNLVLNSDPETGTEIPLNWTFMNQNGSVPIWDNMSHGGIRSIKISIPGTASVISGYPQSDLIDAQPFTVYIASVWGKTQNTGGSNTPAARVVELDANKKFIRQINIVPVFDRGANDWSQKKVEFKTDAKTRYFYVYANIWNGYGDFWMDDIVLRLKDSSNTIINMTAIPTSTPAETSMSNVTVNMTESTTSTFTVMP